MRRNVRKPGNQFSQNCPQNAQFPPQFRHNRGLSCRTGGNEISTGAPPQSPRSLIKEPFHMESKRILSTYTPDAIILRTSSGGRVEQIVAFGPFSAMERMFAQLDQTQHTLDIIPCLSA